MSMEIKAFIFDLDGVITDTAEFHYLAWKKLGERLGIEIDREFNEQLKGVSRMESLERLLKLRNRQNDFSAEEKEKMAAEKNNHYQQLIDQVNPSHLLGGIPELLNELKERNIKIGLASASKNAFRVIEKLEIGAYFECIVDAATVVNGKPDPEIFLKAADALQIHAESCVGVEDAEAGVEAIKAAGMFAVGVGNPDVLARADLVVARTAELTFEKISSSFQSYIRS
jgi:beta-phosphoglucomutase